MVQAMKLLLISTVFSTISTTPLGCAYTSLSNVPFLIPRKSTQSLHHRQNVTVLLRYKGGFTEFNTDLVDAESRLEISSDDNVVVISGGSSTIDGRYFQSEDINGKPHYERRSDKVDRSGQLIHLYWSGNQWILHYDKDPSKNFENLIAYAKVKSNHPIHTTSYWNIRHGNQYQSVSGLSVTFPNEINKNVDTSTNNETVHSSAVALPSDERFGVPKVLLPLYFAFMLDAIAVGLVMPLLPFYIMELGASAMQLSIVISSNYVAQMIGCLVMGQISDIYGRRVVLFICLLASSLSYVCISKAHTLVGVACARIISGSFGGLAPVMQSCVADVSSLSERPKYLGRITATFGMGFVLGPLISAMVPAFSPRQKIRLAGLLPFLGLLISMLFFSETKKSVAFPKVEPNKLSATGTGTTSSSIWKNKIEIVRTAKAAVSIPVEKPVKLLVLNGFLLVYAFATESLYAMFMKDSFGYGEQVLSTLFAWCGLLIGIFQVFMIKPLINKAGKHVTLALGNLGLAFGMIGLALVRKEVIHFLMFGIHLLGYTVADTALVSLISKYSAASTQGRDLAYNQAAQSCAKVISPLFAGLLYERSKKFGALPIGALPFLAAAVFPAAGVAIPTYLYIRNSNKKKKLDKETDTPSM